MGDIGRGPRGRVVDRSESGPTGGSIGSRGGGVREGVALSDEGFARRHAIPPPTRRGDTPSFDVAISVA